MDNTGKNMKEILKKVYYLERINYEQGKMINCLSQRCLELERDKKRELPLENYVSASIDSETIIGMAMFGAVTGPKKPLTLNLVKIPKQSYLFA